jgi:predicted enzyme related to lactoylglutathione lyase
LYFHTVDADATAKAVEEAGGTIRVAPFDVFTQGRMAGFTDPAGAQFAVWQPGETKGLDVVTAANSMCWTELYATDLGGAKTFYHSVFDWNTEDVPMDGYSYTVVSPSGGGQETAQGGIMGISDDMLSGGVRSRWQPYFEVADCDAALATASEHGATVVMGPQDVPGVGRLAQIIDPFGAQVALITSATT